jgi:hypothetical protein
LPNPARVGGGLEAAAGEVGRRGGSEAVGVLGSTTGSRRREERTDKREERVRAGV